MLALTRKVGERIMIGDNISIVVLRIDRNEVRLGLEAPRSVRIMRAELLEGSPPSPTSLEKPVRNYRPGRVLACPGMERICAGCLQVGPWSGLADGQVLCDTCYSQKLRKAAERRKR